MDHQNSKSDIEVAVYDPSYRCDGSYWQWSTCKIDSAWEKAAGSVHEGWPVPTRQALKQAAILYGVIRHNATDPFWFYRVYPAGRDFHGRLGRYFFVLFRLFSTEDVLDRRVLGVLDYFDSMRELPLRTTPLAHSLPEADLIENFERHSGLQNAGQMGHWGFDEAGRTVMFKAAKACPEPATVPQVSHFILKPEPDLPASVSDEKMDASATVRGAHKQNLSPDPPGQAYDRRWKLRTKRVALASLFLVIGAGCWMKGRDSGLKEGHNVGSSKGRNDGYKDGYGDGIRTGYRDGIERGDGDGFIRGEADGFKRGEAVGLKRGKAIGRENGWNDREAKPDDSERNPGMDNTQPDSVHP